MPPRDLFLLTPSLIAELDPSIRAVILFLNTLPGVTTWSSCSGHPHEIGKSFAYIDLWQSSSPVFHNVLTFFRDHGFDIKEKVFEEGNIYHPRLISYLEICTTLVSANIQGTTAEVIARFWNELEQDLRDAFTEVKLFGT